MYKFIFVAKSGWETKALAFFLKVCYNRCNGRRQVKKR